jgi:hypothetical protein
MARQTEAEQIEAARLLIDGTLASAEIQTAVAGYSYDAAELAVGKQKLTNTQTAVLNSNTRQGLQQAATAVFVTDEKSARSWYTDFTGDARAIFPTGSPERALLQLNTGSTPKDYAGFVQQATAVYHAAKNAPADVQAKLLKRSWTPAKLAQAEAALAKVIVSNTAQEATKAAAQSATQVQKAALAELQTWTAEYKKFARKALRGNPQALEALGIKA